MKKINKQNEVEYLNPIQKDNKRKRKVTVKDCIVVFFPFVIVLSIVIFSVYMFSKQQEIITDFNNKILQLNNEIDILKDYNSQVKSDLENIKNDNAKILEQIEELNKEVEEEITIIDEIIPNQSTTSWAIGEEVPLPDLPTYRYLCTDYRHYNLPNTPHYRMQQMAWTDEIGCRRFNDDYIVGLGTGYSQDIGDRFAIELENGFRFTIIMGDGKADRDTDAETHRYTPCKDYAGNDCANVLEFIIDDQVMEKEAYQFGSISYYERFKSNIKKMIYLGRDTNGDWVSY